MHIRNKQLNTPSEWAAEDITKAKVHKLVSDELLSYYGSKITRREFSKTAVLLYEALTGKEAAVSAANPFSDTADSYVLKAYRLGIVHGHSENVFAPDDPITRQDASVILYATLQVSGITTDGTAAKWQKSYDDIDQVAEYASESLQFLNHAQIINGDADRILPEGNTTREETFVMLERLYEKFTARKTTESQQNNIPASGIEAVQAQQAVMEYRTITDANYARDPAFLKQLTMDYTPQTDDYKIAVIQQFIEQETGSKLPGLSDKLLQALSNVDISYGHNTGESYIDIDSTKVLYIVFRESHDKQYILEVDFQ